MTEKLLIQKDNLAKLLAKENLTIVHRKVPTAYFDLKNRILCCPILKEDISPELYDLFMGHEVSHALNTPYEGVHSAVTKNKTLKGYLNVVEDVRIERMIKETYPGLRKSFFKAYNELMDIDFFGVNTRNIQETSLIDKINLITKCGQRVNIKLTDEEQKFLDWAMSCQTWEEVEECATAIYEWSKENETRTEDDEKLVPQMFDIGDDEESDEEEENQNDEDFEDGSDSYDDDYMDSEEDSDEDNLPDVEDTEDSGEEETDKESEDERKDTGRKGGLGYDAENYDSEDGARESITEHNAHNNEEQFISDSNVIMTHINLKEKMKSKAMTDIVYPYKRVRQDWKNFFEGKDKSGETLDNDEFRDLETEKTKKMAEVSGRKLVDKNKKVVMHMAKEFEMKQAALAQAHAFTGKTGKLDMNRLAKYQIVDDVFKRMTYLPDGKNHGVQVLLDWSGSICGEVMDLLEQSLILAMFCKKVEIPFRVYLFSDQIMHNSRYGWDRDESNIRLVEIFSNEMKSKEYLDAITILGGLYNEHYTSDIGSYHQRGFEKKAEAFNEWFEGADYIDPQGYYWNTRYNHPAGYGLGGTPLDQCLVGMRNLIPEFNSSYGIEKSILTIITDGYSHRADCLYPDKEEEKQIAEQIGDGDRWMTQKKRKIVDPYSGKVYDYETDRYGRGDFERTQNILEWLKSETGVITTGYFVCGRKQDFMNLMSTIGQDMDYSDNSAWLQTRKTGTVWETKGYGKLFTTGSTTLVVSGEDELDEELIGAKKGKLTTAFKKNQKSKSTSRFLTNEFIKEIA
jgi:hypothetical protein